MTIYAATGNQGKLAEFVASARGRGVEVEALPGLKGMPEPVEDAESFMGNAELKAVGYSLLAPGMLVMADDSGLEVEALGGEPGVRSARYAEDWEKELGAAAALPGSENPDPGHTLCGSTKDERNNELLLRRLAGVRERRARFVCALAVARDGVVVWRASGDCSGVILEGPRGVDGFGYDPLFLVPELGRTMAELSREEKWGVSHRGRAFRELLAEMGNA